MNRLSLEQVLQDNNTRDPNSISSLKLNHKALSDVSCLSEFKNLERLDLSFNNLTSLEGLKSCVNLKWLSVANNKLQSLKGIEGLSKLTVLNAGKNKLKVMDEVMSIVSLRAVILNDNEIASVCRLEPLRDLNTLVLSRNPIRDIGDSLMKVKSITKLSLSHCQLQTIQSSLKSCIELKELRLAHNDIKGLPAELALNKKLQNLDLGNNVITRWSDLKVLNSLVNLKNLNLQGNPIVEKDKLAKKIKRILPNLHVFNARPIDKYTKNEKGAGVDEVDDSSLNAANKQESQTEKRKDRDFKHLMMAGTKGGIGKLENSSDSDTKKLKLKKQKPDDNVSNHEVLVQGDEKSDHVKKKSYKHQVLNENDPSNLQKAGDLEKESQKKKQKKNPLHTEDNTKVGKKLEKAKVKQEGELDVIDDADTPFLELFSFNMGDAEVGGENKVNDKVSEEVNLLGGLVTFPSKRKKAKNRGTGYTLQPLPLDEIGTGGPSTWGRNHQPPRSHVISPNPQIQQACKATRFPDSCQASLAGLVTNPNTTPIQIIQSAIQVSTDGLQTAQKMVKSILDSSAGNENRTTAAKNCLDVLHNSEYRISLSTDSLSRGSIRNARASMSAALLYQYDCWSALKYANDTQMVNQTMSFLDSLTGKSSNALSMMFSYDNFGNDTKSWAPPKTERDGYWERVEGGGSGQEVRFGVPSGLKADVTVCKEESEKCYRTVQEAVKAAPDNAGAKKFVIRIKAGVYDEIVRVPLEKRNVVFLGDGMGKTVITGSLNVGQPGISTYNTATVGVLGDGFMASGLTIQNTAGPDVHQAVAFRSDSDLSVIENCEFLGNQDTLYAHGNRQFYKSCNIQGNVDFIFGNSAAVFQDCNILVRPRQQKPEKGENNAVTAHGRTDPAQLTGFVFQNCLINGTEEYMKLYRSKPQVHKNYLGRPWKEYSRTVFINCNLEALITPEGWMPWSGDFALKTLFYGEVGNSGAGSDLSKRVSFSSKIPSERVNTYSVQNFIQGNEWIST